ncbi:MAG TPA: tRNA 2-selenouridine(34) synthase MnmH, partial [Phenylobacterium sp.]|nr:tRNA 2-selenouridine(34) synthase MnmH [Phenylobacterium sp.]
EVGTIYVQESRFKARRIGAAYVARNIARHLETALADRGGGFHPLVYCWRGGMRSNAMATILSQVGWRTSVLAGGYRTYRRHVTARLYDGTLPHRFVLLDGQTGSGKTEVLHGLAERGLQALDLEGLAAHRGSLFGALPGQPQPSQKLFESRLLSALDALDPAVLVVAEAESSKIGDRMIPPALWTRLAEAPRIELVAELPERVRYLAAAYADIAADRAGLEGILARLPTRPSPARLRQWWAWIDAGDLAPVAEALVNLHYDPAYSRARRKHARTLAGSVAIAPADPPSVGRAVAEVGRLVLALDGTTAGGDPERR